HSVILCKGGRLTIDGGHYEIYTERSSWNDAVIDMTSGTLTITDGEFDARGGVGAYPVSLVHSNYIYDVPHCEIYGGKFYAEYTLLYVGAMGSYISQGVPYPSIYVAGGEFYLEKDYESGGGFGYCNNGWGDIIVAGGYMPVKSLNYSRDIKLIDGVTRSYNSYALGSDTMEYMRVTPPAIVCSGLKNNSYNRLIGLCHKKHCEIMYEKKGLRELYGETLLEGIKGVPTVIVGSNDTEAPHLSASFIKDGDTIKWYVADETVYGDGEGFVPWVEFADYRNMQFWKYPKRIEKAIDLYIKMEVTHSDGSVSEDLICIHFEEMTKLISGQVVFINGSAKYGDTLTAVVINQPDYQHGAEFDYVWSLDGAVVGRDREFKIDSPYYVGNTLKCTVTCQGFRGELISTPVIIGKGDNNTDPIFPNLKYASGVISFSNFTYDQEYIFSRKSDISQLTEEDWETAYSPRASEGSYSTDYLGIKDLEGKAVYIYSRMKETSTLSAGSKFIRIPLLLGETVNLASLMFDGVINNTIYIPFTGAGDIVEITYKTDPLNANVCNSFFFRTSYPVSLVSPTDKVTIENNTGKIQLKLIVPGTTTLTASYITYTEVFYARVNIVVYDPESHTIGKANVATPMEDQTIAVGQTLTVGMPQFIPEPPEGMEIKWYLSRSTRYGVETFTENEVARIDPDTGLILGLAPGNVNVSLMTPNGDIDTFVLTVTEPDGKLPVSQVYVSHDKVTLKENESISLNARIYPANATETEVKWSSSAPGVARVDENGRVTAVFPGVAVITAEVDGVKGSCTVTVLPDGFTGAVLGDLNFDGKVNARDKALLTSYIKSGEMPEIADLNGDGKVNARDKAAITQLIKGK
ncbi:MAG: Ig-like domain-containing protein, partial [Clostridia bacterium]|nr:Ig-like domain-containing protein [Clostridia bacterium]